VSALKKILACCLLFFLTAAGKTQESKPTLVYIFDPLCGWCYSFDLVMEQIHQKYTSQLNFVVIPGGMVTGKRVKPVGEVSETLLEHMSHLEHATGAKFGEPYKKMLEEGKEVWDSERPSWAVNAFKTLDVEDEFTYAYALQKALFLNGHSLNQDSTYQKLAQQFGIEPTKFRELMYSDSTKSMTSKGFAQVESIGVQGFPTVLIQKDGKTAVVTEGFEKFEKLDKKIEKALKGM